MNRRSFLASGATLALQGAAPPPGEILRVGCLNVSSFSHLNDICAPFMNPRADKKETAFTRMRITHCWEIDPEKGRQFAQTYGCEAVRNFDDMVGKVDAIISGGYYNHPWNHILHQPYLEAGLPNLINRPFANSLAKAWKMIETARKHRAPILVPSSFEHNEAIARAKAWAEGKKILCYYATNSFDDYPTHGVHGVYMIFRALAEAGHPIVSVAYHARSWHSPPGVLTFEHTGKGGNSFFGTLHQVAGSWATIRIDTPEHYGGVGFEIPRGTGFPYDKTEVWAPVIWAFEKMARYGEMPQTLEHIYEKTRVFLAGWRSVLNEGRPVRLDDVPEEWESPVELPNHPGDVTVSLFRKKFGG